jgi:hypothetical protein
VAFKLVYKTFTVIALILMGNTVMRPERLTRRIGQPDIE